MSSAPIASDRVFFGFPFRMDGFVALRKQINKLRKHLLKHVFWFVWIFCWCLEENSFVCFLLLFCWKWVKSENLRIGKVSVVLWFCCNVFFLFAWLGWQWFLEFLRDRYLFRERLPPVGFDFRFYDSKHDPLPCHLTNWVNHPV